MELGLIHMFLSILLLETTTQIKTAYCCEVSIPTLAYVKSCPQTEEEWKAAARRKQCEVIEQKCSPNEDFQYHCVINPFANATVEVCSPVRNIIGHCAEYNNGRKSIQDHQKVKCKTCPASYRSTEAYKYQECYEMVFKAHTPSEAKSTSVFPSSSSHIQEETTPESLESNKDDEIFIISTVHTFLILMVIVFGSVVVLITKKFRKYDSVDRTADSQQLLVEEHFEQENLPRSMVKDSAAERI